MQLKVVKHSRWRATRRMVPPCITRWSHVKPFAVSSLEKQPATARLCEDLLKNYALAGDAAHDAIFVLHRTRFLST